MDFKYVKPKAVDALVGTFAPVSSFVLAGIIEEALDNANKGYVHTEAGVGRFHSDAPEISDALKGIADRLLNHNLSRGRQHAWDLYSGLDFDLVHESNPETMRNGRHVNTSVKAYFHLTQFSRPPEQRRVVFHLNHHQISGTQWSISFPVQMVMKGFPWIEAGHFGYSHGISTTDVDGNHLQQHNYIGVTKRSWLQRMAEHFREIEGGSNRLFHSAWREYVGSRRVHLTSELIVGNHSFEEIMAWEEWQVDEQMNQGTSLNMIPGGFKGMRFLHEHRLTGKSKVSLEERDSALKRYQLLNPRAGIPNLIIGELWNNPEYAESVICGVEGRLSADQVRRIRSLSGDGVPIDKIVELVSARNALQVERVLKGITYSRIH